MVRSAKPGGGSRSTVRSSASELSRDRYPSSVDEQSAHVARCSSTGPAGRGPASAYSGRRSRTCSQLTRTLLSRGQVLGQALSGPVQPNLDGALLDPQLLGDLLDREAVDVLQQHGDP